MDLTSSVTDITYFDAAGKVDRVLPVVSEDLRKRDVLQAFYREVARGFQNRLYMRNDKTTGFLVIRSEGRWLSFGVRDEGRFWPSVWAEWPELVGLNWSVSRLHQLWEYFWRYPRQIRFDNKRYFELPSAVLDTLTGSLHTEDDRFLRCPTYRYSELDYHPGYTPSQTWQGWYDGLESNERAVREWSVAQAVSGGYGCLLTSGNSRTGKSTLAEGISTVLGDGAQPINISADWGRFGTKRLENTTYLYDPDNKASKQANLSNYEELHKMMAGDPIQVEIKGGELYKTTEYGFLELISNDPLSLRVERSLVDRVRFCLYTFIDPRGDGGNTKRRILADKQAWLNFAITCAIRYAKGDITRPPIDTYQALGWHHYLRHNVDWYEMSYNEGRPLTYSEYSQMYTGPGFYKLSKDTVEECRLTVEMVEQYWGGGNRMLTTDWEDYEKQLKENYYNGEQ